MSDPRLVITDGTTTIDLLGGASGYSIDEWPQAIVQPKGGGTWLSSSLSDGRRLADLRYTNARQVFPLCISAGNNDLFARKLQDLQRLLAKASEYRISQWNNEPVWLEKRTGCESNTLYAMVEAGTIAELDNQFSSTFPADSSMSSLALEVEHGHWHDCAPGEMTCVQLSTIQSWDVEKLTNRDFETAGAGPPTFLNWAENIAAGPGVIAADAVIFLPDLLSHGDLLAYLGAGIDGRSSIAVGKCHAGVEGEGEEQQEEKRGSTVEDVPGHALGEGFVH